MEHFSRWAAVGLVIPFGAVVLTGFAPTWATAGDKPGRARANAATFTIKDVTIDQVDEVGGTISVSIGKNEKPTKLVNVPLGREVRVVASHVLPGFRQQPAIRVGVCESVAGQSRLRSPRCDNGGAIGRVDRIGQRLNSPNQAVAEGGAGMQQTRGAKGPASPRRC